MARRSQKREPERHEAEAPRPDLVVVALSVVGFGVASYLTWLKWAGRGAMFCVAGSGCDVVQASRYAVFVGVPTALWGAVLYAAIAVLGSLGLSSQRWLAAFLLGAAGVGFSAYLTALSFVALGAACIYCLASGAIVLALVLVLLWRRPPARGRKSAVHPIRLAAYGTLMAVVAVVFGAFVFASPSSAPRGYQSALARHLRATGAVMYGAYW